MLDWMKGVVGGKPSPLKKLVAGEWANDADKQALLSAVASDQSVKAEEIAVLLLSKDPGVQQRAGALLEDAGAKYRDLEARLDAARTERDALYERLREREEAERALGNRPLSEVKRELDNLIKERKSLADRLAKRFPDADTSPLDYKVKLLTKQPGS